MAIGLDFRKPKVAVVESCTSWSGKYFCFLGNHYHQGHTCWVLGSSNRETGEIKMVHYNTAFGAIAPKAQCETSWREFKQRMLRKPESEITDDNRIPRPWETGKQKRVSFRSIEELLDRKRDG